jgi:hypothetical protein
MVFKKSNAAASLLKMKATQHIKQISDALIEKE